MKLPCKFNIDVSVKSLLERYKYKLDVYDWYIRYRAENYNDVVVSDVIYRPDAEYSYKPEYTNETTVYITKFSNNGATCSHCDNPEECSPITLEAWKEDMFKACGIRLSFNEYASFYIYKLFHGINFTNSEDNVVYEDGEKYKVFYNNYTMSTEGRNNKDIFSLYVDSQNRIAYAVTDNDRPGVRTEYKFKYSLDVEPKDFVYKEKYVWNCSRPEVMKEPTKFQNTKCSSASVAHVALLALLASLVFALLF